MPFVGRTAALAVLHEAAGQGRNLVLVTGPAGMGKTALLVKFAEEYGRNDILWGTCWGDAPALWPWTQAVPQLKELARIEDRLELFDAISRCITKTVVILDDLQWSDPSSLALIRYLMGAPHLDRLLILGAYRDDESNADLAALSTAAQRLPLRGVARSEADELIDTAAKPWADSIYERSGGNPFFLRELSQVVASGGADAGVPRAIREVVSRRLARLSGGCVRTLEAAAVAGPRPLPDVLAEVLGVPPTQIAEHIEEAAGVLSLAGFEHDLYRESIYASLSASQRVELHHQIAQALLRRCERGAHVHPAELAGHFTLGVAAGGPEPALRWALSAAAADRARFAFAEAAGHLARARDAAVAAGMALSKPDLVNMLAVEAADRLRAADPRAAQGLLAQAWALASEIDDPEQLGMVALGIERIGARFAMPRHDLIAVLDQAQAVLQGTETAIEAQVTAGLARQLQHSVPSERPRARPLAQRAVEIARALGDPATLADCLLAEHDCLWAPGTAPQRLPIAREIAVLAQLAADSERHAQALLLVANALLENGSPGFRPALAEYFHHGGQLRQARQQYLLRTREAALAILDGDAERGEQLSREAAAMGEAISDPDAGNVAMSQRLELIRLSGDPTALRQFAAEAVRWWVGVPAHAHAVAAGFLARAGDLDEARQELDLVRSLGDWRLDRSYLWSVFIGEMTEAAVRLHDRPFCAELLAELLPVADACAVNGALVCFMGANAHRIGQLYAALDQPAQARQWWQRALQTHRVLGARAWEKSSREAMGDDRPVFVQDGQLWQLSYEGRSAILRDAKGLRDLATLISRPGVDISAVDLAAAALIDSAAPILDRAALASYRQRLRDIDEQLTASRDDIGRHMRLTDERETLLAELRQATRPSGESRNLGMTTAERCRKAVTARIRDTISRIKPVLPELAVHLDRSIRTGLSCRYDPITTDQAKA
ncbi:MAG: ATPase-like protein [Sphaerisporangium sp.]|nr:ATPase-like protein [Sphaerisporangium sp.]